MTKRERINMLEWNMRDLMQGFASMAAQVKDLAEQVEANRRVIAKLPWGQCAIRELNAEKADRGCGSSGGAWIAEPEQEGGQ